MKTPGVGTMSLEIPASPVRSFGEFPGSTVNVLGNIHVLIFSCFSVRTWT